MQQLLISVIVPIYNADRFLTRCCDSIIKQSYKNIELILVNDGSTDNSAAICDEYVKKDSRVVVIHKKNAGVSEARNSALDIAKGDYIHCVDADDWIEKDTYTKVSEVINKNCNLDLVKFEAYNSDNQIINKAPFTGSYSGESLDQIKLAYIGSERFGGLFLMGVPWMYIISRKLIVDNQIKFNKDLRRCEDRLFIITCLLHATNVFFTEDAFYHYETNQGSLSNKYDPFRWDQEKLYLIELQKEYSKALSSELVENANTRIKNDYMLRAIIAINNEFFSNNSNKFKVHYSNTRKILDDPILKEATKKIQYSGNLNLKEKINLKLIIGNQPLLLTTFNTLLVYKHKTF